MPTHAGKTLGRYRLDALLGQGDYKEAIRWFHLAVKNVPREMAGRVAMRAAKLAREKLGSEADALEFLRLACRSGNAEACREVPDERPQRERPWKRRPVRG